MMKFFISSIFLLFSCSANKELDSVNLNGYWIPDSIDWKEGSFKILQIQDTSFFQLASTQAKDEKDSIYFMVEPGVNLSGGTVDLGGKNRLVRIRDLYKDIPLLSDHFPGVTKYDTLYVTKSYTFYILYQGKKFVRTERLKKKSIAEIDEFVKNFAR